MLGYTWVVFKKFSVLFSQDGYLFPTKFLYFFHEMGTFFSRNFLYFLCKMGTFFVGIFFVCFPQGGCHLHRIFCIFQQGGYLLKGFFFCILVSKWVVSLSLMSLFLFM